MLDKILFLSKSKILYAVFRGTFFSSNIIERLSPLFTSWINLFFNVGGAMLRSSEIVICSIGFGFSWVESKYKRTIAKIEIKIMPITNLRGVFLKPIFCLLED